MQDDDNILITQIGTMATAGMAVPVDPDIAERMGAFADDALSPEEALGARFDAVAEDE